MNVGYMDLLRRIVEWWIRVRPPEARLVTIGGSIVIACLGINFVVEGHILGQAFRLSTGEGATPWIELFGLLSGAIPLLVGIGMIGTRFVLEVRRESRSRVLVIELRGLRTTPDAPLQDARLPGIGRNREELLFDLRQGVRDGDIVDPRVALTKLSGLPTLLQTKISGRDRRDIQLVIGGLAPVPFLTLAGMYLDDESSVTVADWERLPRRWRTLDGQDDDGAELRLDGLEQIPPGTGELVVAVSVSYRIGAATLDRSFPGLPRVEATLSNALPDLHWSGARHDRLCRQFNQLIVSLGNRGVEQLHLALAVPAALAIALGMGYDRRNYPAATVYQFESAPEPHYPWGVALPARGAKARIVNRAQA